MMDLTNPENQNTYLPSEIWEQYIEFHNNKILDKNNVILLRYLKSSLVNIDDLVIDVENVKVVDSVPTPVPLQYSQGYIEFDVCLKIGAKTNIGYSGNQFQAIGNNLVITNM